MAVNVTIEDDRSERDPAVFAVPDGCRIVIRRCADSADVLVLPDADPALPPAAIIPAGAALQVATWGIIARESDQSFLLRLQDGRGHDHDFIVSPVDLAGIATAAQTMAGRDFSYEAARTRKMIAEAELAEAEARKALRCPSPSDGEIHAEKLSVGFEHDHRMVQLGVVAEGFDRELTIRIDEGRVPWLIEKLAWAFDQRTEKR